MPEAAIADAPKGSAFVIMTHDHGLDFLIGAAALSRTDAAYVGMIGSATKREKFRRFLEERGEASRIGGSSCRSGPPRCATSGRR